MTPSKSFDRTVEDVGNILGLEHFNFTVPDQELASLFYVSGLGLTRDPYMDFATFNMWVNAGEQQFHLPKRDAQVFRGHVGLVIPDHQTLERRLSFVSRFMDGTKFAFSKEDNWMSVTCPWGNEFRVFDSTNHFGMELGIPFGVMLIAKGSAQGIVSFYREILGAPARLVEYEEKTAAEVDMGYNQKLIFKETNEEIPSYDGHHIAIYIADFSGPHRKLQERELVSEESDQHQYRFQEIVDPESGTKLAELEHEVRSLHHPMRRRVLVNRNAAQTFGNYQVGRDSFVPS